MTICDRCGEANPAEIHTCSPNYVDRRQWLYDPMTGEVTPLYTAPPPQEPVAWMTNHDEPLLFPTKNEASKYCNEDEEPQPLYTAPPQRQQRTYTLRKWQGLTDEERKDIFDSCESEDRGYVAAMVEAKLKEKNT